MNCPKCGNDIGLIEQIKEWVEMAEEAQPPVFTNLWCGVCRDMTMSWFLEENDAEDLIETTREEFNGKDISFRYPKKIMGDSDEEDS